MRLRLHRERPGPRKVVRPRLPPNGTVYWAGVPLELRGVTKTPLPLIGVENERQLPVTGSSEIAPFGLKSGRSRDESPLPLRDAGNAPAGEHAVAGCVPHVVNHEAVRPVDQRPAVVEMIVALVLGPV